VVRLSVPGHGVLDHEAQESGLPDRGHEIAVAAHQDRDVVLPAVGHGHQVRGDLHVDTLLVPLAVGARHPAGPDVDLGNLLESGEEPLLVGIELPAHLLRDGADVIADVDQGPP